MTLKRLVLIEAEKLLRSSVFWVAPVALAMFLGLMLLGFEVYAAKAGGDRSTSANVQDRSSSSVVVSSYIVTGRMISNFLHMLVPSDYAPSSNDRVKEWGRGDGEKFDYFGNTFKNLLDPKSFPKPEEKELPECVDPSTPDKPTVEPLSLIHTLDDFFTIIGTANAAAATQIKPVPKSASSDLFVDRVADRFLWLLEPEALENRIINRDRYNGIRFTYFSLYFAFIFMFPLITLSVVSQMVASEFTDRTIGSCLLRSITREQLLYSKAIVIGLYLLALVFTFILITLLVGVIFCGSGNLYIDSGLMGVVGENRVILKDGAIILFLIAGFVATIALLPLAAIGVLLSFIKPEPSTVIGLSSIIYFLLYTLGGLPLFEGINLFFFTTYMNIWPDLFLTTFPASWFFTKLVVCLLIVGVTIFATAYIFKNKDIYV